MPRFLCSTRYVRVAGGAMLVAALLNLSGCGDTRYSLQATIQNLDGSGLTLSVNGASKSVLAGTTTQTLAPALASGLGVARDWSPTERA